MFEHERTIFENNSNALRFMYVMHVSKERILHLQPTDQALQTIFQRSCLLTSAEISSVSIKLEYIRNNKIIVQM